MTKLRLVVYDKTTGNRLYDCSYDGSFIEPTIEQLQTAISDLQPFDINSLGLLRFENGEFDDNFAKYHYHADASTQSIIWDTANPIGASLADVQSSKIAQLNDMYNQTLASGFNVTVNGVTYVCGATATDRGTMSATQDAINSGFIAFPFDYADIYGGKVPLTSQTDLDVIKQVMTQFGFAQHKQILDLIEQVRAQTTNANGEVDAIQWTPATY